MKTDFTSSANVCAHSSRDHAVQCACASYPLSFPDCNPQPQTQNGIALASALYPARKYTKEVQSKCYSERDVIPCKLAQELLRLMSYACQKIFMRKMKNKNKMMKNTFFSQIFSCLPRTRRYFCRYHSAVLSGISLCVGLFSRLKAYLAISC